MEINVRGFIQHNYAPYEGDGSFLASVTNRIKTIRGRLHEMFVEERKKGVLDVSQIPSSIIAHGPNDAREAGQWLYLAYRAAVNDIRGQDLAHNRPKGRL